MRISNLEIKSFRGLPNVKLDLDNDNLVVWGPNGAGKSGVVDAIEFLFSGKISRLDGEGTQRSSLPKHGPHVLGKAADAVVTAKIQIKPKGSLHEISRTLKPPRDLVDSDNISHLIYDVLSVAEKRQLCLTRRDILRFIATEGKTRSERVQSLLDLSEIEQRRASLIKFRNRLRRDEKESRGNLTRAESSIADHCDETKYSRAEILEAVNVRRRTLGGSDSTTFKILDVQQGIQAPTGNGVVSKFSPQQVTIALNNLTKSLDSLASTIFSDHEKNLRDLLDELIKDNSKLRLAKQVSLVEAGIELVDENSLNCPLCDSAWQKGELLGHLNEKRDSAAEAAGQIKSLTDSVDYILSALGTTRDRIKVLLSGLSVATKPSKYSAIETEAKRWDADLKSFQEFLTGLETFESLTMDSAADIDAHVVRKSMRQLVDSSQKVVASEKPVKSAEQVAWEWIIIFVERKKERNRSKRVLEKAELVSARASAIAEDYIAARDSVLSALFNRVSARFKELYVSLHSHVGTNFKAEFTPDEAALDIDVKFDDGNMYPPNAVHSEGHQDSMGICLFLALREEIGTMAGSLVVLDDVVMSVDIGHRKSLCDVLKSEYPDTQIVITTHDRTWARQLIQTEVVPNKNSVQILRWSLSGGPVMLGSTPLWEEVDAALKGKDLVAASAKIRQGSEEYLSQVCDDLEVPVNFRSLADYDLGQLLLPALEKYKRLLKMGKAAATQLGDPTALALVEAQDKSRSKAAAILNAEWWMINSTLHFNVWHQLQADELQDIAEAMKAVHDLFRCEDCGSSRRISKIDNKAKSLTCTCTKTSVNLSAT